MTDAFAASPISGRAALERIGERSIVRLPEDVSAQLPSRGQVAVSAVLGETSWDAVVEPDGRRGHWLPIAESLRHELGLEDGDDLAFTLQPTKAWPEPDVPADLQRALRDEPETAGPWRDITPMARWEWVRWIKATKNPQTRARRVEVTISKLLDGKRRPCCFDLSSCTDPELAKSGKLVESA